MLKGRVRSASLPNGFSLYAMRKPEAEAVTVQVWVATGSVNEGDKLGCGLSHFLEHMLFQGTKKYPGLGVADAVHKLGGDMNAYTSHNCTVYYISLPCKSCAKAIDILADMVMNPTLPEARFKLEKGVILRERDMNLDRPERVLSEQLWREMFLQHPVRHPIIGYREKIEQVDRDMAAAYHALRYSPSRSFMVVVGDVDEEEALKLGSDAFAAWPMGRIDEPVLPVEPPQCCPRHWEGHFKDPLARVSSGWRIPSASHEDVPALDMLSCILGGGPSSRLHKELKTRRELALGVSAYSYATNFDGAAGFSATCPPEKLKELVAGALGVFREVREGGVTREELTRNVSQQSAEYLRGLRANAGVARIIGGSVLTFGSPDFGDKYIQDIAKLTIDDISKVAAKYFDESALTLVELAPEGFKGQAVAAVKAPKAKGPALKTAPGGQRMIHHFDKSLPLVEFCVVLPGGLIWEPSALSGSSKLLSACIPCGTKKLSEDRLADLLDDEAADFSVLSGGNTLSLRLNCRKDRLDKALDAVASLLASPAIPEREFERERRNLLDSIASRKSSPQGLAEDVFSTVLYGGHPYAHPSGGDEDAIKSLEAAAVRRFHLERCLVPRKAVFAFAGDIERNDAFERIERMIARCKWNAGLVPELPCEPRFPSKARRVERRLDKQQAVLMTGVPACANDHPDRDALDILCTASNSQSSKLFKAVREDKGLAYYTGLMFSAGIHRGHLAYYAGTDPKTVAKVESLIEKERRRIVRHGMDKDEFSAARECVLFDLAEEMQNTGRLIFSSALAEFYGLGFMSPWTRSAMIAKLKMSDVNGVAAKYLSCEAGVTALVSPSV